MPSTSTAEIEGTPEVKQWTDAELISLAEHMQQEIEIRDRQALPLTMFTICIPTWAVLVQDSA